MPLTITSKKNKILRTKIKEVKDLYSEHFKTLMKEIENDTHIWEDYSWIGRINIAKMSRLSKAT